MIHVFFVMKVIALAMTIGGCVMKDTPRDTFIEGVALFIFTNIVETWWVDHRKRSQKEKEIDRLNDMWGR